ncbi:hypothetical protein AK812_SmicGene1580 [Symbiodinium microadriaticum]|uniref:SWIM-type domain-containing protein n=1 Tax=Symbiodinium microadriaticum TaxID=2951 RepID=A0A1Q9F3P2_SYMMI|nr:hypothetical protein AK812_SmicGene1580 [Symbiodinium microadriaticum]
MGALGALANLAEPSWSNQRSYTQFRRLPVASAVSFFYHRSVCGVVLPSDRRWLNRELALSWPKSGNAILEQSRRVLQLFLPRSAILDDDDFALRAERLRADELKEELLGQPASEILRAVGGSILQCRQRSGTAWRQLEGKVTELEAAVRTEVRDRKELQAELKRALDAEVLAREEGLATEKRSRESSNAQMDELLKVSLLEERTQRGLCIEDCRKDLAAVKFPPSHGKDDDMEGRLAEEGARRDHDTAERQFELQKLETALADLHRERSADVSRDVLPTAVPEALRAAVDVAPGYPFALLQFKAYKQKDLTSSDVEALRVAVNKLKENPDLVARPLSAEAIGVGPPMLAVPPMSGAGKHAAPDAQPAGPPAAAHRRPAAAPLYAAVAPAEPTEGEEEEEEAEEPERCIVRTQVEMEAPMSHAQEWKQEWGRANLPARIHGPGFRPCVSKRRIKERCARAFCLCAGEDARRAPKCTVVYTGIYCAATKLFTIEETGSHHRPAEGEQVQEASARKPRRNCRALMLDLPEVYTKTVQQQPKSTLDFVQQANKWSRDPDNFKGSEGEKPFKVDQVLHRLSVPVQSWVGSTDARAPLSPSLPSTPSTLPVAASAPPLPNMRGGGKKAMAKPAAQPPADPSAKARQVPRRKPAAASITYGDVRDRLWYQGLAKQHHKLVGLAADAMPQRNDATRLVSTYFQAQTVHGDKPAHVHVYPMTSCLNFRVACSACKPRCGSCQLANTVTRSQSNPTVVGQSNRGRKRKSENRWGKPEDWEVPGDVLNDKGLRQLVKDHFYKHALASKAFKVQTASRQLKDCNTLKCEFRCSSHLTMEGKQCKWQGVAHYDTQTRRVKLETDPETKHGPMEKKLGRGMTVPQRRQAGGIGAADAFDILCAPPIQPGDARQAEGAQELRSPPKMSFLAGWTKRRNKRLGVAKARRQELWRDADFHAFINQLQAAPAVGDVDELLRPYASRVDGKKTSVTLLCPALVKETLERLQNPRLLKLYMDGTYHLLYGKYVLLSVGALSKQWSTVLHVDRSHHSSFNELGFAIAHAEHDVAYSGLVQSVFDVSRQLGCDVDASCVRQWHADMHTGISKARRSVVPESVAVDDWAHVVGATAKAGNGGARKLLKEKLQGSPEERASRVSFLLSCMYTTRAMPARPFHAHWTCLLHRVEWASPQAATAFAAQYLCKETVGQDALLSARWRAPSDRMLPGSACGTAPQEAWHMSTLKRVTRRQKVKTPSDLAQALQTIVRSKLVRLRQEERALHDWPGPHAHVALACLTDDAGLGQEEYAQRIISPLPSGTLTKYVRLIKAHSQSEVARALHALGVTASPLQEPLEITNWSLAKELFGRWCLVVVGPHAQEYWRHVQQHGEPNIHVRGLCTCHEAALHGPCEHLYAAFLHLRLPEVSDRLCMTVRHDRGGRTKTGASPTTSSQPPCGSVRPGPRAGVAVAPPEARPRPCVHESVVDLVQTVSGAELCSKRVAALSTLGVHTLADLRLLSEAHLRTEAGFTLTESLRNGRLRLQVDMEEVEQPRGYKLWSHGELSDDHAKQTMGMEMLGMDYAQYLVDHAMGLEAAIQGVHEDVTREADERNEAFRRLEIRIADERRQLATQLRSIEERLRQAEENARRTPGFFCGTSSKVLIQGQASYQCIV